MGESGYTSAMRNVALIAVIFLALGCNDIDGDGGTGGNGGDPGMGGSAGTGGMAWHGRL